MMYRQHFWHGNGIVRGTAISGHRHRALGHPRQDPRRALPRSSGAGRCAITSALYCHLGGGRMEDFYETDPRTTRNVSPIWPGRRSQTALPRSSRWRCRATMPLEGLQPIRYAEACVAAMREAVGDDIDIMVDCHARPSPRDGLAVRARRSSLTASTSSRNRAGPRASMVSREIQRAVTTPIATGERVIEPRTRFASCSRSARASVCQPDITHCGGFTEARRIAALAEAYRIALAPHNPQGPVSTAASLEFGFSSRATSSAKPSTPTCPGGRTSCRKASPSRRRAASCGPTHRPGLGIDDQRGRSRRSIRSSRKSLQRVFLQGRQRGRLVGHGRLSNESPSARDRSAPHAEDQPSSCPLSLRERAGVRDSELQTASGRSPSP